MDTVSVEKGKTFQTKNGDNFVVISPANPENVIMVLHETRYDEFTYFGLSGFSGDLQPRTLTIEEFQDSFRSWIPSLKERKAAKKLKKAVARERYESFKDDYAEALKIDILIDAARGGDIATLMERFDAILGNEKKKTKKARSKVQKAYEEGFEKGKSEGFDEGFKYPRNSLEATGYENYEDS